MALTYEITACPVCGGEGEETLADGEEIRRELEELWEFHLRRLRTGIPVRHLFDRVVFSQEPPLRLSRCPGCGTVYRNPRERAEAVVGVYEEERPDAAVLETLFDSQREAYRAQARRLTRVAGGAGRGLEIGSYIGAFLAAAREEGWEFEGLDVNRAAIAFAREKGLSARPGTLEDAPGDAAYSTVAIWNCFEQLPDPRVAARAARELLGPGGILAVRVPNGAFYARWRSRLRSLAAPIARAVLAHNNLLGFPYRHGFTPGSLRTLLAGAGFEVVEIRGDVLVPLADRWTRAWAAREERLVKAGLLRLAPEHARPWIELYARAV